MNRLLLTLYFLALAFSTFSYVVKADRRKRETRCGRNGNPGVVVPDLVSLSLDGDFLDYTQNFAEQLTGHNPSALNSSEKERIALTAYNKRVDASEEGVPNAEPLAQEGRSFCISGEHFRNVPELFRSLNFGGMRLLALNNFDIGSNSDSSDYSRMNIFPWAETNLPSNKPTDLPFIRDTATDGTPIYAWENSDEIFHHTRLTFRTTFPARPLHQGFRKRPAVVDRQPDSNCENPYFIDVTEIDADGVRLHNWLHITVYVKRENIIRRPNCATGKMRYIMLEVRDSLGIPIGDFNADVNCSTSCKCKSSNCIPIIGAVKNAMPCMHTPLGALTQPGIFMYSVPRGQYFDEVHVSWHFAQHVSYFAYQLHFAALIVEHVNKTRFYNGRQTKYENPLFCHNEAYQCIQSFAPHIHPVNFPRAQWISFDWIYTERPNQFGYKFFSDAGCTVAIDEIRKDTWASKVANPNRPTGYFAWTLQHISNKSRPYGWTPQYTVLFPTMQTLGGWDIFQEKYVQISRMNCHKKVDNDYFEEQESHKGKLPFRRAQHEFKREYEVFSADSPIGWGEDKIYNKETAMERAGNDSSDWVTKYSEYPITTDFGDFNDSLGENATFTVPKIYFGTEFSRDDYGRYEVGMPPAIRDQLRNLQALELLIVQERCACPAFGTTEDPEAITRPAHILLGRRDHATQMLIAWVALIPIGLFCIRYYKETYSKVFLLQEFWWYSVHVLCMGTAWIFMLGGIYAIEIKRKPEDNFSTSLEALIHIIFGIVVVVMFTLQLFLSPLRLWSVKLRVVQIIFHFTFGMIEYTFAVVCILLSAAIPQGRMSCTAFYIYVSFLVVQVIIYLIMEAHMSYVDKLLDLFPPRTYLPPPVVRLFHTSAPLSKMRTYILGFYTLFCCTYFLILDADVSIEIASCFRDLGNDYDEVSF